MSGPAKYRKKPVVIDAVQWDGTNSPVVLNFLADGHDNFDHLPGDGIHLGRGVGYTPSLRTFDIPTLEGTMTASPSDWIIRGIKGEFYPCRDDIFQQTYEAVDE